MDCPEFKKKKNEEKNEILDKISLWVKKRLFDMDHSIQQVFLKVIHVYCVRNGDARRGYNIKKGKKIRKGMYACQSSILQGRLNFGF